MEENIFLLMLMILGHLLADYPLQGWLAQAKSKSYWENAEKQNKHDYIPALVCHCVMWGILVFLPITFFCDELGLFWLALPINIVFHCIVDDLKANKKAINLWQDQFAHLTQIFVTWVLYVLLIY